MVLPKRMNDAFHWYMNELTTRVVAESGIPGDRYHLGKIILQSFKDAPDFVMQIDGATGESETNDSALHRSVRCAISMKNFGVQKGDVMVLMAPNHLDLAIPFYAALYLGVVVAAVDRTFSPLELQGTFGIIRPKIIFCQSEKAPDIQLVLNEIDLDAHIVTFDKGDYLCSFHEFLDIHGDDTEVMDFKPTDFDTNETTGFFFATSGTTGLPKSAVVTHKNFAISTPYLWCRHFEFPTPTRMCLVGSPLQWLTALFSFVISPVFRYTRLQSSENLTREHATYLINTFKPTFSILSPTMMTTLLKQRDKDQCDLTSFELLLLGGSAVPEELIKEIKGLSPETEVFNIYGMSELTCLGFYHDNSPPSSCGKPIGCFQYRLIDVNTSEDITDPNVPGELWMKGPCIFKEYYMNPEATDETFAENGWFKTGDMFYRDENWNYFFVERIKLLLKYKSYQISPVEVENVIRQLPGVLDVAVSGLPDPECGELPVAVVVVREGHEVSADDVKDIVKDSLSDAKQLRGGVIFVDAIPMTASTKVHRRKLKTMVFEMERL